MEKIFMEKNLGNTEALKKFKDLVDIVIDGGYGDNEPSTVIDCTTGEFDIIREGKGDLSLVVWQNTLLAELMG